MTLQTPDFIDTLQAIEARSIGLHRNGHQLI
jgi:hypothetical protein